ncbi:MAG: carboxymuconolactone decarboxylase family protein [Solirubrobacteraceae bacterium]
MPAERQPRLQLRPLTVDAYRALQGLATTVSDGAQDVGIDPALRDLINIRASQINGCAFCIDLHVREARERGDDEQRIYSLAVWRDVTFFTARERAVLSLTESITLIHDGRLPDAVYEAARAELSDAEIAHVVWVIAIINVYNRLAISTRMSPSRRVEDSQPPALKGVR